ncbi:MAG: glycosyltransferase family 2 protein [Candidatus Methanoperedens sp.]|nr:glycosyltransferase family 2 protein [Candidatus Methanoperedens sp.]
MCIENNMKLLSICIPTYNRPDKLKEIYQNFLVFALHEYGDQVEVVVRDNSDEKNARINRSILEGTQVRYYKNETNVYFCGNQVRLIGDSKGQFIWIVSDDDLILMDGFKQLMSCLPTASKECIDCLILPINYRNNMGELIEHKYGMNSKGDTDIEKYLKTLPVVPFGYFAEAVIRVNKSRLDWVAKEYQGNEIINIPLFLTMLKPESKMRFLDKAVIEYHETYYVRGFDICKYYYWHREVTSFLEKYYNVDSAMLNDNSYKEFLLMVLVHRVGLRIYPNIKEVRRFLVTKIRHNLCLKSIALATIIVLPGSLVRHPYLFYLSVQRAHGCGGFSIKEVVSRYSLLNNFIRTKEDERRSVN